MTHLKKNRFLSLFLVLALALTMLPTTAFAAELPEENHIHTEECVHEQAESVPDEEIELEPAGETALESEPEPGQDEVTSEEQDLYSGTIGDSSVQWTFDPSSGMLMISGSGGCERFSSADDQPWAHLRTQISEVWFNDMDTLQIYDLAYWFEGCTALKSAEIPYTTTVIGENSFAGCAALERVMFYHMEEPFTVSATAFYVDELTVLEVGLIPSAESAVNVLYTHDWSQDNRATHFIDVYGTVALATGYCSYCKGTYSYSVAYEQWTSSVHCIRYWCSNCGMDQCGGANAGNHSYNNSGYCTYCGYYNSAYDNSSVCYHTSTYTTWSGCNWYKYCNSCGTLVNSGTSHGTYVYGSWTYYSTTQHRRSYACSDCGQGSYSYASHSTSTKYAQYSSSQHTVGSYCATCGSYVGSLTYESHNFTYGAWSNYSSSQHRRTATCSDCGYSTYEYASHSLSYGSWSSASDTEHSRTASCSCGYSTAETANHSFTYGAWASVSDTEHSRSKTCSCGYSSTETGSHTDADNDGSCDDCGYLMSRFSVTVPATLNLTVAKNGKVYAATSAQIVNNSTGAVCVTSVKLTAENGWQLVPFATNMADEKVDAKRIGFALNGAESDGSAILPMSGSWGIAKGTALSLDYDAVVSATSNPINEQVLTVVFVLDWAA
jgi:hypothetical protein